MSGHTLNSRPESDGRRLKLNQPIDSVEDIQIVNSDGSSWEIGSEGVRVARVRASLRLHEYLCICQSVL